MYFLTTHDLMQTIFILIIYINSGIHIKLMKGKALMKHSLHEKTAASDLLKLFISGNEWWHTTDAPLAHEQNSIFKCKQHTCTLHDPWGPDTYDYTMM